jgi:hypothetical protein
MLKRLLACALLALTGCVSSHPTTFRVVAGYCDPPLRYQYDPALSPLPDFEAALTPALLARYPRRNLLTANAVGILPLLQELAALEDGRQQPSLAYTVRQLELRQRITNQIALVSAAVASVAAELDCEGERADQVGAYLENQDDRRTQRLNVLSITIGAASGIGTTVFEEKRTQYVLGIGGGLAAAGLGLLTLYGGHQTEFLHARNLLTDVWQEQPVATTYPPHVWYMLREPGFSNSGQTSIAHNTRQRWQQRKELANPSSKAGQQLTALLFGNGGQYSAEQLALRADMLNELQSAVHLLNQELQGLLLMLEKPAR